MDYFTHVSILHTALTTVFFFQLGNKEKCTEFRTVFYISLSWQHMKLPNITWLQHLALSPSFY